MLDGRFRIDESALARPLVQDLDHARLRDDRSRRRQRPMHRHALLAMQHKLHIELQLLRQAVARQHGRHRRHRAKPCAFEDERQLTRVVRIPTHPDAERIEHGPGIVVGRLQSDLLEG